MPQHSRGLICPGLAIASSLEKQRAQGRRVFCAPAASCAVKKAHEIVTTGTPKQPGLPCAMAYGSLRALPGVHDLVSHRRLQVISCTGCQDHTACSVRVGVARLTSPTASIASRPTFVTTRTPLLPRRDGVNIGTLTKKRKRNIFAIGAGQAVLFLNLRKLICPSGKSVTTQSICHLAHKRKFGT